MQHETLGEELRAIRLRRGFSLRGMSFATKYANENGVMQPGLAITTILRIEDGSRANPHLGTIMQICELLDIEVRIWPDGLEVIDLQNG